jgi:hypothetical protein
MSDLSVKGVLLGALSGFALMGVMTFGCLVAVVKLTGAETGPELSHVVDTSWAAFWIIQVLGIGALIVTGYMAAWIAKRGELLNGVLASWLLIATTVFSLPSLPSPATSDAVITVIMAITFCFLGGFLRRWQVRRHGAA